MGGGGGAFFCLPLPSTHSPGQHTLSRTRVGQYQAWVSLYPLFLSEEPVRNPGIFEVSTIYLWLEAPWYSQLNFSFIPGPTPIPSLHPLAQPRPISLLSSFPSLLSHFFHIYSNFICCLNCWCILSSYLSFFQKSKCFPISTLIIRPACTKSLK